MRLPNMATTVLLLGGVSSAKIDTTLPAILDRMHSVASDMIVLNSTLNNLHPNSLNGALVALQVAYTEIRINQNIADNIFALKSSTTRYNTSESLLLEAESERHVALIKSMLANMIAHKPAFESAVFFVGDLSKTIHSSMKKGRMQTRDFVDAAERRISTGNRIAEARTYGDWDEVIRVFRECGEGKICLPDFASVPKGWIRTFPEKIGEMFRFGAKVEKM